MKGLYTGNPALAGRVPRGLMTSSAALLLALSAVAATDVSRASAQEQAIEEVVVTARYRQENLQQTPLAITAVTAQTLESRSATSTLDLDEFVPNVVIAPLGAGWGSTAAMFIRGVGLGDNSLSFEPGVPIYIDDVYFGRPQGAILDLLDLERVEVLRGPQGTLFGKNALGGAVRFVSKKPQGDGSGKIEATYGSRNRLNLRGSFDVSLVPDKVFLRVAGSSKTQDGYFDILDYECVNGAGSLGTGGALGALGSVLGPQDNRTENGCVVDKLGNENVQSARASLRIVGGGNLEVNINADVTDLNQKGPADKYTYIDGNFPVWAAWNETVAIPDFGVPYDDRFITDSGYTGYHRFGPNPLINRDLQNVNDLIHWGVAGTIDWDVSDAVHVKSITAYRRFTNTFGRDSDGSPLPGDHTWDTSKHRQFSEELQISGVSFGDQLEWTVGGFYYDAKDSNQGWNYLWPFLVSYQNHHDTQDISNWAVFGHLNFHVTDRLSISGGLRYTDDRKTARIFRQDAVTLVAVVPNTVVKVDETKWSPKISVDYKLTDDVLIFASYSTGFRGGGFGPRPANALQVAPFQAENIRNYETGFKSEWFKRRLRLNGNVFYAVNTDKQSFSPTCAPCAGDPGYAGGDVVWFRTVNTGKSRTWGVELEMQAEPVAGLRIDGSLGYQNYFLTDPGTSTVAQYQTDGSRLYSARTPKWNWALGAEYEIFLGRDAGSLTPRLDWTYQSTIKFTTDPVPDQGIQPGYHLLNARMTWVSPEEEWSASFYVLNLTDKYYFHGKLSLIGVLGREQGNPAAPREWGLTVRRTF